MKGAIVSVMGRKMGDPKELARRMRELEILEHRRSSVRKSSVAGYYYGGAGRAGSKEETPDDD